MSSSGNREWAYIEAKRRAHAMNEAYSIYRHRLNEGDYIVRNAWAAPPDYSRWNLEATFQADGTRSFLNVRSQP